MIIRQRHIETQTLAGQSKRFSLSERIFKLPNMRKQIIHDFKIECGELGQKMIEEGKHYYVPAMDKITNRYRAEFKETKAKKLTKICEAKKDNDTDNLTLLCIELKNYTERKNDELNKDLLELGTAFDVFSDELEKYYTKNFEKILERYNVKLYNIGFRIKKWCQEEVFSDYVSILTSLAYRFKDTSSYICWETQETGSEYFERIKGYKIEKLKKNEW